MKIHGIVSSYFGDQEWDLGKSVRWVQFFCDTEYALDASLDSRPRDYVISWSANFPDVRFSYLSSHDFFAGPDAASVWRQTSFERAAAAWDYADDDWVLFVDCTEGICIDTDNPPPELSNPPLNTNVDLDPFRSYVIQEIDNAGPDVEVIYLPTWVFVRNSAPFITYGTVSDEIIDVIDNLPPGQTYQGLTASELRAANRTENISAYSYFTTPGYLPRLVKVSALRDPGWDWTSLDTWAETVPDGAGVSDMAMSLLSYAYARWTEDPTQIDPATGFPATEEADTGYNMRTQISRVRPVPGLPTDSWPPVDDAVVAAPDLPDGLLPQAESVLTAGGPEFNSDFGPSLFSFQRRDVEQPADPWGIDFPQLKTLMYPSIIRDNPREGLFFQDRELGPVPWSFLTGQPALDPNAWVLKNFPLVPQSPS